MTENRRAFEETISQNIVVVNGIYAAIAITDHRGRGL
jgi:hypothetical protein